MANLNALLLVCLCITVTFLVVEAIESGKPVHPTMASEALTDLPLANKSGDHGKKNGTSAASPLNPNATSFNAITVILTLSPLLTLISMSL